MLCLMLAKNWAVLSIGWAVLAFLIIAGVVQRFRRTPVAGQPLFELGLLIWADLEKINRWIRPVAGFVLLLGLSGWKAIFRRIRSSAVVTLMVWP